MAERKLPVSQLAECGCGRIGYALVLCQEHAPIPYELTERAVRLGRHMRQWDAIEAVVVERMRERQNAPAARSERARMAWRTRRAGRSA